MAREDMARTPDSLSVRVHLPGQDSSDVAALARDGEAGQLRRLDRRPRRFGFRLEGFEP
jgi:hypothetical protein